MRPHFCRCTVSISDLGEVLVGHLVNFRTATSEFGFGTTENGWLMAGNSLIRGLFLLIMFPKIIFAGREWFNKSSNNPGHVAQHHEDEIPTRPEDFAAAPGEGVPQEPVKAPEPDDEEDSGTGFDLLFVQWSLVVDSIVTAIAGFSSQGWQAYMGKAAASWRYPFFLRTSLTKRSCFPPPLRLWFRPSCQGSHDRTLPSSSASRCHCRHHPC
jgi:hypothetical protein